MSTFDAGTIEAKLILDRSNFKRGIKEAKAEAKQLEDDGIEVNADIELDTKKAEERIKKIEAELEKLQNPDLKLELDTKKAEARIKKLRAELAGLKNEHVKVEADTAEASAKITKVKAKLDTIPREKNVKIDIKESNGVGRTQLLIAAILAALPLIPPLVAVAGAGIVGLAAALTAAAVGAGILGLGIYAVISQYENLVKKKKELTESAKQYQKALDGMTKAWQQFTLAVAPGALSLITQFFKFVEAVLPKLVPIFDAFAKVAGGALTKLSGWVMGPEGTRVLKWFQDFGSQQFGQILTILGNVGSTLLNIMIAFSPLAEDITGWLVRVTNGWVTWSRTLQNNPQFQQFIQYVRDNGPAVGKALQAVWDALVNIGVALAPLGPVLLDVVTNLGNFIANMDPDTLRVTIEIIAGLAAGWTALEAALSIAAAASVAWSTAAAIATPVTWAFATALGAADVAALPLIGAILIIIAVIALLALGFYFAYQKIEPFRNAVNATWEKMAEFGKWLGGWIGTIGSAVGGFFVSLYQDILGFGDKIRETGKSAWTALKSDTSSIVSSMVSAVVGFFEGLYSKIVGFGQGIRQTGINAFQALRSGVTGAVSSMVGAVTGFFSSLYGNVSGKVSSIYSTISSKFNSAKSVAVGIFSGMVSAISGKMSEVLSTVSRIAGSVRGVFDGAGGWLLDAGRRIIQGLIDGIRGAIGGVQSVLSSVTNLIPDWKGPAERDARLLRPNGNLVMQGFIAGIFDQLGPLKGALGGITDMVGATRPVTGANVTTQGRMGSGGGSAGPNIEIKIFNPVAEPSSLSAIGGIKDLAVLGVFG